MGRRLTVPGARIETSDTTQTLQADARARLGRGRAPDARAPGLDATIDGWLAARDRTVDRSQEDQAMNGDQAIASYGIYQVKSDGSDFALVGKYESATGQVTFDQAK